MVDKVKQYLKETLGELKKMTWPTKDEMVGSTVIVIVVSLIVALFIGAVDRILTFLVRTIFGGGIGG
ncbi:MAG TPA: preprotein translocase subunit SecE [Candidatus Acidoferrum sp.]|nr:preprotein translocase subunit SecE [Candidatus Acidoferrum sp.]